MRVQVETALPCDAELAWQAVQTRALLQEVCRPLVTIYALPGEQLPERWQAGRTVRCRTYLFGLIPLGIRTITFERCDTAARQIQSREHDFMIRKWDHLVEIEQLEPGHSRYRDTIEIEAGLLTLPVWLFASVFYRHRQRRWKVVAMHLT
jgi:hypothetical protein